MSDYVRTKGIVYPIPKEKHEEVYDLIDSFEFQDLSAFWSDNHKGFSVEDFVSDSKARYYLVYQLSWTYGDENGEFGAKRELSDIEKQYWTEKFEPILSRVEIAIEADKFRYMDWCYYNACESYDYYAKDDLDVDTIKMDNEQ